MTISSKSSWYSRSASSAGSPTSMLSWNCWALVTRPSLTSKQAISRLASIEILQVGDVEVAERLEHLQAGARALLGVELRCHDVLVRDRGREFLPVCRDADQRGILRRNGIVGIHEVIESAGRE